MMVMAPMMIRMTEDSMVIGKDPVADFNKCSACRSAKRMPHYFLLYFSLMAICQKSFNVGQNFN